MTMEAETGVKLLWPKECPEVQSPERGKKYFFLEVSEGAWPCSYVDYRLLHFLTMKEYISVVLSHQVYRNILQQFWETGRWNHFVFPR